MDIRNSAVCVVGGAGFLGSHLVDHLIVDRACDVVVVDNLAVGRKEFLHSAARFEHADITCSEGYLARLFDKRKVCAVFNYAAHPYIPLSFERPSYVFATNATGAINVINAAADVGVPCLQVSSAELYGEAQGRITEQEPVRPRSTYGASKAAVDAYVQARWREAKVRCVALRQFNCVGERETHPYVVPEILSQLKTSGVVRLGNNTHRDFMYAGDAVRYAVELLEAEQWGEVFNLGSETTHAVYEIATMLSSVIGEEVSVVADPSRARPWDIWHLHSDNSKIHSAVSYRAEVDLRAALERTWRWYVDSGWRWPWE